MEVHCTSSEGLRNNNNNNIIIITLIIKNSLNFSIIHHIESFMLFVLQPINVFLLWKNDMSFEKLNQAFGI